MKKIIFSILLFVLSLTFIQPVYALGEIVGPDVIYKASNSVLTLSTIKDLYSSVEGDIEVKNDNYTGFGDVPGIYTITFGVENKVFEKNIDVSVRQSIGDVIAVTSIGDDYTIHMHKNKILSSNEIVDVLVNVQMMEYTSTTEITILTNSYEDNSNSPGLYVFEFHIANTAGFEAVYEVDIKVNDTEKLLPDIVYEDPTNFDNLKDIFMIFATSIAVVASVIVIMKFARSSRRKKRKGGLI